MLQERPQQPLWRLALILVPALAGALAWSYAHRDRSGGPSTVRFPVIASAATPLLPQSPPAEATPDPTEMSPVSLPPNPDPSPIEAWLREPAPIKARPPAEPQFAVAVAPPVTAATDGVLAAPPPSALPRPADDPSAIRLLAERRLAGARVSASNEQWAAGVRLLQTAALLGDGPARARIARDYGRSAFHSLVPPKDAIRYALDDYAAGTAAVSNRNHSLVTLAALFAARGRLETFAAALVEAIAEDSRLQSPVVLEVLLGSLAHVRGSCRAVARAVAVTRLPGVECPRSLQTSLLDYVRQAGRSREDDSRRRGLQMLQHLGGRQL